MDNMCDVLALSRSRAQNYKLLLMVRRHAACNLVLRSRIVLRWIPSEWNPADAPSRLYEDDTDLLPVANVVKHEFNYSNFPFVRGVFFY